MVIWRFDYLGMITVHVRSDMLGIRAKANCFVRGCSFTAISTLTTSFTAGINRIITSGPGFV